MWNGNATMSWRMFEMDAFQCVNRAPMKRMNAFMSVNRARFFEMNVFTCVIPA